MKPTARNNMKEVDNSEIAEKTLGHDKNFIRTMSYTSKMAAVDIEFNDLTYAVRSSRKGKGNLIYILKLIS